MTSSKDGTRVCRAWRMTRRLRRPPAAGRDEGSLRRRAPDRQRALRRGEVRAVAREPDARRRRRRRGRHAVRHLRQRRARVRAGRARGARRRADAGGGARRSRRDFLEWAATASGPGVGSVEAENVFCTSATGDHAVLVWDLRYLRSRTPLLSLAGHIPRASRGRSAVPPGVHRRGRRSGAGELMVVTPGERSNAASLYAASDGATIRKVDASERSASPRNASAKRLCAARRSAAATSGSTRRRVRARGARRRRRRGGRMDPRDGEPGGSARVPLEVGHISRRDGFCAF